MEGRQEQHQATGREGGTMGQVHANLDVMVVTIFDGLLDVTVVADVDVVAARRWAAGGVLGCGVLSVASQTGILLLTHT